MPSNLTEAQISEARERWSRGQKLGEIARAMGVSLYALSPWLYMESPEIRQVRDETHDA